MQALRHHVSRIVSVAMASLVSACTIFGPDETTPLDFPVHGIDVSHWQGEIDWHAVKRAGTAFAFIKATEGGDHLDRLFLQNWYDAQSAGVPRSAYHFYYFCRPVEDQIAWYIENVPNDPNALPPVLDMEWNAHSRTCPSRHPVDEVRRDMAKMLKAMEAHFGKKPIIYTSVDFHADVLAGGWFKEYPFWVRSVAAPPEVTYPGRIWTFWQYTAEGRVPGVKGDVDRNAYVGSRKDWQEFLRANGL